MVRVSYVSFMWKVKRIDVHVTETLLAKQEVNKV